LLNEVRSRDVRIASTVASNDFNSCSRNRMLPITFGKSLAEAGPKTDARQIQDIFASDALCDGLGDRTFRLRARLRPDPRDRGYADRARSANMSAR
jgi:hypothetical protein